MTLTTELLPLHHKDLGVNVLSNSEVSTFLQCERRHYYSFGLKLEPKSRSTSLSRGIIGHEALAGYYLARKAGKSHDAAQQAASEVIQTFMKASDADIPMLVDLVRIINGYFAYYGDEKIEILSVEESFIKPFGDYGYGMRADIVLRFLAGPYAGDVVVMDHKFVYDFWTVDNMALNPQIPKYIAVLRDQGFPVTKGVVNQLRWRKTKDEIYYRRESITPSDLEIRNIMREQLLASEQIMDLKADREEWPNKIIRTMNTMVCKNCPFTSICKTELIGEDATLAMQVDFQANTYETYEHADS